jgi:hypothetical protein
VSQFRDELAGAVPLLQQIGVLNTIRVAAQIERRKRAGEPFEQLGEPASEDERLSRVQAGAAVLLYRALVDAGIDDPIAVTRAVMMRSGASFLRRQLGRLQPSALAAMPIDEAREQVQSLGAKFFNATIEWKTIDADGVRFDVTHCHFPGLCAAAGHPELAPLFCAVDDAYFGRVEPNVRLKRDETIATGGSKCAFELLRADTAD